MQNADQIPLTRANPTPGPIKVVAMEKLLQTPSSSNVKLITTQRLVPISQIFNHSYYTGKSQKISKEELLKKCSQAERPLTKKRNAPTDSAKITVFHILECLNKILPKNFDLSLLVPNDKVASLIIRYFKLVDDKDAQNAVAANVKVVLHSIKLKEQVFGGDLTIHPYLKISDQAIQTVLTVVLPKDFLLKDVSDELLKCMCHMLNQEIFTDGYHILRQKINKFSKEQRFCNVYSKKAEYKATPHEKQASMYSIDKEFTTTSKNGNANVNYADVKSNFQNTVKTVMQMKSELKIEGNRNINKFPKPYRGYIEDEDSDWKPGNEETIPYEKQGSMHSLGKELANKSKNDSANVNHAYVKNNFPNTVKTVMQIKNELKGNRNSYKMNKRPNPYRIQVDDDDDDDSDWKPEDEEEENKSDNALSQWKKQTKKKSASVSSKIINLENILNYLHKNKCSAKDVLNSFRLMFYLCRHLQIRTRKANVSKLEMFLKLILERGIDANNFIKEDIKLNLKPVVVLCNIADYNKEQLLFMRRETNLYKYNGLKQKKQVTKCYTNDEVNKLTEGSYKFFRRIIMKRDGAKVIFRLKYLRLDPGSVVFVKDFQSPSPGWARGTVRRSRGVLRYFVELETGEIKCYNAEQLRPILDIPTLKDCNIKSRLQRRIKPKHLFDL